MTENEDQKNNRLASILSEIAFACEPQVDDNFRDCMIEEASKLKDTDCAPKTYLIASQWCGGCETAKQELQPLIDTGQIIVLDSNDPIADNLMKQADAKEVVPMLAITDCDGNLIGELEIFPSDEESNVEGELQDQT